MTFVGRVEERQRVRALLVPAPTVPVVVHVQGMAGIGKSALLDQLAEDAVGLGFDVHAVPRDLPTAERAQHLRDRLGRPGPGVVVVDDWHALGAVEASLVEQVERSRGPLVLIVGSRSRPRSALVDSALFPGRLFTIELGGLEPADGARLLVDRGLPPTAADEVYRTARGQPFAMLMLASARELWHTRLELGESVASALVHRLVGQVADQRIREVIDLVALVGTVNERELKAAFDLPDPEGRQIFDQLREFTLVRTTSTGLELHPIARSALLADLHHRDPVRARPLVERALVPIEEALDWSGIPRQRALGQLRALASSAPQDVSLSKMFEVETPGVEQARERDLGDALALIEALEGEGARRIAHRFATFDPTAVTLVRDGDRVDGVMIRVDLRGPHVPAALSEPATDRLVEVLSATGELREGGLLRVTRFFLARGHHQQPCPQLGWLGSAITRQTLDTHEPFVTAQHLHPRAVDAWRDLVATMGFRVREDAAAEVDGRRLVPCIAHFSDLGAVFSGVVRRAWGVDVRTTDERAPASELGKHVALALHHLRDTVWLETSTLGAQLFGDGSDRAVRLQQWLDDAIASTEGMRHGDLVARALRASFGAPRSGEEAAAVAGMGLSTLKRYRKQGIEHITALAERQARR